MAYVPISQELHGDKRWVRHSSMLFAKTDTVAPLLLSDLAIAVQALPIAFVKHEQGFVLVALMGFRSNENLLVSPQGEWLSEYMPAIYRSSPFELLPVQDHHVLGIDEACIIDGNSNEGEPFFNGNGEITQGISEAFEKVQRINSTRQITQHICVVLMQHNLIEPWPISFDEGDNKQEISGLHRINEEAINALTDEAFLELRHANALPLVYAQLYSMRNLNFLARLAEQRPVASNKAANNETFSFAGL